jgi:adenylyltransferase/sulfurtransferase
MKILAGKDPAFGRLLVFDLWQRTFEQVDVAAAESCPSCAMHKFDSLDSKGAAGAIRLCGRNSVEILPEKDAQIDLKKLEETLSRLGKVQYNGYSLWFETERLEFAIFPDGRAIVKGTDSPTEARAAYAKFISL